MRVEEEVWGREGGVTHWICALVLRKGREWGVGRDSACQSWATLTSS